MESNQVPSYTANGIDLLAIDMSERVVKSSTFLLYSRNGIHQ